MNKRVSLEENSELVRCDGCEFSTTITKDLRAHIVNEHTVNVFRDLELQTYHLGIECDLVSQTEQESKQHEDDEHVITEEEEKIELKCAECEFETNDEDIFNQHTLLHKAEVISNSLQSCPKCNTFTNAKQRVQCESCYHFYHKQCTDRKGKGGRVPKNWNCGQCKVRNSRLNVDAPSFDLPSLTNVINTEVPIKEPVNTKQKLPPLTGKHRKSGLCEHPDVAFLEMQIDTLKSTMAQKDLENTKLKQSDTLKTKQIIQLEAKLQEAMNTLKLQKNEVKEKTDVLTNEKQISDEDIKIHLLENKTSALELQFGLLSSKLDSFLLTMAVATRPSSSPNETQNKHESNEQKQEIHERKIFCRKCDF